MSWASEIAADAPTAWWRLGESSGTSAADSSGNGHTGTYQGSPTLGVAGLVGSPDTNTAARFASGQDVLVANVATLPTATSAVTIEALFAATTSGDATVFCGRSSAGGNSILRIYISGGNALFGIRDKSGAGIAFAQTTGKSYNDGNRHHLVATRDSSKHMVLYVDGVSVATATDGMTSPLDNMDLQYIAYDQLDGDYFAGTLDEVAVYNGVALSAARVSTHFGQLGFTGALQPLRVSQVALEVLDQAAPAARVSQAAIEVLKQRPVTTFVGVSQVAVEVLVPVARRARFYAQIV